MHLQSGPGRCKDCAAALFRGNLMRDALAGDFPPYLRRNELCQQHLFSQVTITTIAVLLSQMEPISVANEMHHDFGETVPQVRRYFKSQLFFIWLVQFRTILSCKLQALQFAAAHLQQVRGFQHKHSCRSGWMKARLDLQPLCLRVVGSWNHGSILLDLEEEREVSVGTFQRGCINIMYIYIYMRAGRERERERFFFACKLYMYIYDEGLEFSV